MKTTKRHSWTKLGNFSHVCSKCGCKRYWDFDYDSVMYSWGTKLTYNAPKCIMSINGDTPYNPDLVKQLHHESK